MRFRAGHVFPQHLALQPRVRSLELWARRDSRPGFARASRTPAAPHVQLSVCAEPPLALPLVSYRVLLHDSVQEAPMASVLPVGLVQELLLLGFGVSAPNSSVGAAHVSWAHVTLGACGSRVGRGVRPLSSCRGPQAALTFSYRSDSVTQD